MGQKVQALRSKVKSTIHVIRTKSSSLAHAGLPASAGKVGEADELDAKERHMQLHNKIVRALLVDEVVYEPSRLLKKSRRAVVLITGADLVLVKMTKATSTGSGSGSSTAAEAQSSSASAAEGSSDGGAAADVAQATVLAQHELNKMVKCELHGSRLELEFIVTGSARFKVSPAALGFSSSSGPDTAPGTSSAASAPGTVPSTKSLPTAFGRSSNADTTAAADQQEDAAQQGGMLQRRTHSAPSAVLQFAAFDAVGDAGDAAGAAAAMNLDAAPAQMAAGSAGATAADTAAAADPADEGAVQQLQQHVDPAMRRAASMHVYPLVSTGQPQVELGSTPPAGSSNTLRWSPHRLSSSSGSPAPSSSRSRNYVRSFGTSMIEGASRSVSSSISNFRLVKTDDGEYWVCVESFTLQFRDSAMCQLAASLLRSGRSSMRIALDWLKQGLPFTPGFAVTHITELSSSRTGNEVLVAGATPWGTELQLPDSWTEAIATAQLPEEQPLMTPLEVVDGPAAFKLHLATPAGLAEATLLPEMLALLAGQVNPQHTGQLLAVPVRLQLSTQSTQIATSEQQQQQHLDGSQNPVNYQEEQQQEWQHCPVSVQQQQQEQQHTAGVVARPPDMTPAPVEFGASGLATAGNNRAGSSSSSSSRIVASLASNNGRLKRLSTSSALDNVAECEEEQQEEQEQEEVDTEGGDDASCYNSCAGMNPADACRNSGSASSTQSMLGSKQPLSNSSSPGGCGAEVAGPPISSRLRVEWSEGAEQPAAVHCSSTGHIQLSSSRVCSTDSVATTLQADQPQEQQQQQPTKQRVGLRSKAKRAAKRLLAGVLMPSSLAARAAGNRTVSGPPGGGSSSRAIWDSSKQPALRHSKSDPEGMVYPAAESCAEQVDDDAVIAVEVAGAYNKKAVDSGSEGALHRDGSCGDLRPMSATLQKEGTYTGTVAAAAVAAAGAVTAPAAAATTDVWSPGSQPGQQQQHHGAPEQQSCAGGVGSPEFSFPGGGYESSKLLASGTGSSRYKRSSLSASGLQPQDDAAERALSFVNEMYAVIHVQLVQGSNDSSSQANTVPAATLSPFAEHTAAGQPHAEDVGAAAPAAAPSVLVLGNYTTHRPALSAQEQQLLSAAGLLAGLLCGLGMLLLQTLAGRLLVLAAAALNAACMAASARPGWVKWAVQNSKRGGKGWPTIPLVPSNSVKPQSAATSPQQPAGLAIQPIRDFSALQPAPQAAPLQPVPLFSGAAAAAAGGTAASGQQQQHQQHDASAHVCAGVDSVLSGSGLRLRLLGGSFKREALGLLEEQILAYKSTQGQPATSAQMQDGPARPAAAEAGQLACLQHDLPSADSSDAVVLVSSPEPDWLTPDWRRRIMIARPNLEERRMVANMVHAWRNKFQADKLLNKLPPAFEFFQQNLTLKPLLVTPQGYVVLLLKLQTLVQVSRATAAAGLSMTDMMVYCGFLWSFMFKVLAPHDHPAGRIIMITDMSNIRLGQAIGEGQTGARAFGDVTLAWPERLCRCLVVGAPSWFTMLYRMVQPHMSPNTRAKVQVCGSSEAAAELARCLGPDLVPKEFGGPCTLAYDEYPAQKLLLQFVEQLQQQEHQ